LLSSVNIEHVKKLGRRKVGVNAGKAWPLIYVAMSHLAVDLELRRLGVSLVLEALANSTGVA
jgi:hypothetical protein